MISKTNHVTRNAGCMPIQLYMIANARDAGRMTAERKHPDRAGATSQRKNDVYIKGSHTGAVSMSSS